MALPVTFVAGDVLEAAQLNSNFTYLEGVGGLQLVKTQTIGTAVGTVAVTDAFSATYENYLITVSGGASTTNAYLSMILGATTAGYNFAFANAPFSGAALSNVASSAAAIWDFLGYATTSGINMAVTLQSPQLAKFTFMSASYVNVASGAASNNGFLNNTTQYTGFTISPNTGTLTGGTIRVYGYANS
jgi:hypothetical protein